MADIKNPANDALPTRRPTGDKPVLAPRPPAPPPPPVEAQRPRPAVAKGDGMTTDKPALPSEQRPEVKPRGRPGAQPPAASPAPPMQAKPAIAKAPPPRRKGGYGKGDGMTAPKPQLDTGAAPPATIAPPGAEAVSLRELIRRQSNPNQPAVPQAGAAAAREGALRAEEVARQTSATTTRQDALPSRPQTPPDRPRGAPTSAPSSGLKAPATTSDLQALPLPKQLKNEPRLGNELEAGSQLGGAPTLGDLQKPAPPHMAVLKASATDAEAPAPIPPELLPLTPERSVQFQEAYMLALKNGEPWAVDLHGKIEAENAKLIEQAGADPDDLDGALDREGGRSERPVRDAYTRLLSQALRAGQPWAHAMAAETADAVRRHDAQLATTMTDVDFDPGNPSRMSSAEWEQFKKTGKVPVADDGSMKVPPTNDPYVREYVKTNPFVEDLRRAGQANQFSPLYDYHLQAAIPEQGDLGGPPPDGKGYLAMTRNGFAYCWNPKLTAEENRKVAEFSLRTGMAFDRCDGMNDLGNSIDKDLEALNDFDPTKPGNELKILLDRTEHGKDKVSIKVGDDGTVSTEFYFRIDRGDRFRDNAEKYGTTVVAVVLSVVATVVGAGATVPTIWQTAAAWAGAAAATQNAYQAARSGNWLGAVFALATGVAGLANVGVFGNASGEIARIAGTATNVVKAVNGIRAAVAGIENKDLAAALAGVATTASSVAAVAGTWHAGEVQTAFEKIAKYAEKYGTLATFGAAGVAALKKGDYLTALSYALDTVGALKGEFGLSDGTLKAVKAAAGALRGASAAIQKQDWAGAIEEVLKGVDGYLDRNDPAGKDPRSPAEKLIEAGITIAGIVSDLKNKDPMGAAKLAGEFIQKLLAERSNLDDQLAKNPNDSSLKKLYEDITRQLEKFGGAEGLFKKVSGIIDAIKKKDYVEVLAQASSLAGRLTQSGWGDAAAALLRAARNAVDVIKRGGSFEEIARVQRDLANAVNGALALFDKTPPSEASDALQTSIGAERTALEDALGDLARLDDAGMVSAANEQCAQEAFADAKLLLERASSLAAQGHTQEAQDAIAQAHRKIGEGVAFSTMGKTDPALIDRVSGLTDMLATERGYLDDVDGTGKIDPVALGQARQKLSAAEAKLQQASQALKDNRAGDAEKALDEAKALIAEAHGIADKGKRVTVKVGPNDTLSDLAKRYLGDANKWPELYMFNRDVIGPNPHHPPVGKELVIPPSDYALDAKARNQLLGIPKPGERAPDQIRADLTSANTLYAKLFDRVNALTGPDAQAIKDELKAAGSLLRSVDGKLKTTEYGEADEALHQALEKLHGVETKIGALPGKQQLQARFNDLRDKTSYLYDIAKRLANDPKQPAGVRLAAQDAMAKLSFAGEQVRQADALLKKDPPDLVQIRDALDFAQAGVEAAQALCPTLRTEPASQADRSAAVQYADNVSKTVATARTLESLGGTTYGYMNEVDLAVQDLKAKAANPATSEHDLSLAKDRVRAAFDRAIDQWHESDAMAQAARQFGVDVAGYVKLGADFVVDTIGNPKWTGATGLLIKSLYHGITGGLDSWTKGSGFQGIMANAFGQTLGTAVSGLITIGLEQAHVKGLEASISNAISAFVSETIKGGFELGDKLDQIERMNLPPAEKEKRQKAAIEGLLAECSEKVLTEWMNEEFMDHTGHAPMPEGVKSLLKDLGANALRVGFDFLTKKFIEHFEEHEGGEHHG